MFCEIIMDTEKIFSSVHSKLGWESLKSSSASDLLTSLSRLSALPWTDAHTASRRKTICPFPHCPCPFMAWPLLQSTLTSWTNPLSHGSVLLNRSDQDQPGCLHFLHSVQLRPKAHLQDSLCGSQSSVLFCSLLFTLTPPCDSYRSLEPAIQSVNRSNTQTNV